MKSTIQKHSRRASSPGAPPARRATQASSEAREGEAPGLAHAERARGQRPLRLVHAVDLEVVDLVDRVAGGVQHRRHERAPEHGQQQRRSVTAGLRVPWAPQAVTAPLTHAEGGRQQREGPREVDVGLELRSWRALEDERRSGQPQHATATSAPIAVLAAFSRSLSIQPRRSATVPRTLSARLPRRPATRHEERGAASRRGRSGRRPRPRASAPTKPAERALEAHRPLGARAAPAAAT